MRRIRHHNRSGQRRLPLLAILGICFGGAFLIALVVGLILNATLDDEAYYKLTTKPRSTQDDTILFVPDLPDVVAYPYAFGGDLADVSAESAVSLALNTSEGSFLYKSEVLTYFKAETKGSAELSSTLASLDGAHLYISGIFYPFSLRETQIEKRL